MLHDLLNGVDDRIKMSSTPLTFSNNETQWNSKWSSMFLFNPRSTFPITWRHQCKEQPKHLPYFLHKLPITLPLRPESKQFICSSSLQQYCHMSLMQFGIATRYFPDLIANMYRYLPLSRDDYGPEHLATSALVILLYLNRLNYLFCVPNESFIF